MQLFTLQPQSSGLSAPLFISIARMMTKTSILLIFDERQAQKPQKNLLMNRVYFMYSSYCSNLIIFSFITFILTTTTLFPGITLLASIIGFYNFQTV